ncbi:hypothetical protein PLESTB_000654200 [Pleodorina starrii]|uniref:DUF676 domain-containing protein n=1 Tax=Pleodorina starrii TaxID=330485 RepID=A0A9W6BJC2_9CHLO|nr:hypothetical protein PLESTB_000654200 [Pleodorina starrii]GLC71665.1 hypothetical protein PLESTF_001147100 [Pleodorina starrii]
MVLAPTTTPRSSPLGQHRSPGPLPNPDKSRLAGMLAGLKSKLGALPSGYAVPLDGGAALALAMRPSDHPASASPRPPAATMATAAGSSSGAAAAGAKPGGPAARAAAAAAAAKSAAAAQFDRFDAWRHGLMTRLGSAMQSQHLVSVSSGDAGSHGPGAAAGPVGLLAGDGPARGTDAAPEGRERRWASHRISSSGSGDGAERSSSRCGGRGSGSGCWQRLRPSSVPTTHADGGDDTLLLRGSLATAAAAAAAGGHCPGSASTAAAAAAAATAAATQARATARWRPSSLPSSSTVSGGAVGGGSVGGGRSSGSGRGGGGGGGGGSATHLIVLANGLFGSPSNWSVICEQLQEHLDPATVVLHPSKVNRRTDTYDGIDVCGQRLADEIRSVTTAYPSLQRISVIGHSMGGLLLRYAIGVLYNPSTGRVAGLRPSHFITLATPHMGCDADGLAQVPFIGWVPVKPVQRMLQVLSIPTASLLFRRTGRQFFMADGTTTTTTTTTTSNRRNAATSAMGGSSSTSSSSLNRIGGSSGSSGISSSGVAANGTAAAAAGSRSGLRPSPSSPATAAAATAANGTAAAAAAAAANGVVAGTAGPPSTAPLPLLYRMTQDEPERGLYFYSALASFASRTAYANTDGDHLVGWANSSLRFMHQLPTLAPEAARARGVVLQDPLMAAFDVRSKPDAEPQRATGREDLPIDLPPPPPQQQQQQPLGSGAPAAPADADASSAAEAAEAAAATAAMAEVMLRRLQRLPWRRIDVSFQGAVFGLAHNNIQVTRRWLNFEGLAVAGHVARQVVALEEEWARMERQQRAGAVPGAGPMAVVAPPPTLQPQEALQLQQQQQQQQQQQFQQQQQQGPAEGRAVGLPAAGGGDGGVVVSGGAPHRQQEPLLTETEAAELLREAQQQEEEEEAANGGGEAEEDKAQAAATASAIAAAAATAAAGATVAQSSGGAEGAAAAAAAAVVPAGAGGGGGAS